MQGRPPLRWRTMTYHHFWKYYQLIHQLGAADFWKLQMPFIGHPTHTDITLVTGSADFTGVVRPLLFLSAMGWSTNLNIRLRGHMRPSHLQDFVSLLPHKSASFFEVNGTRKTLPEVFEFFAARVRQDVYQPNLVDTLKLKRYLVMTLSQFSGEIGFYRSPSAGVKQIQIPAADRALLHSILTGTTLDVPELIRREQQKKFLLTRFADPLDSTNPDFALTYFDHGSLIFMQRTALTENYTQWKGRRAAMRCHASNIRNYLLMTLTLYSFYRDTKKEAAVSDKVAALRHSIHTTLLELPRSYTNPFCLSFHGNYGPLLKLSPA